MNAVEVFMGVQPVRFPATYPGVVAVLRSV